MFRKAVISSLLCISLIFTVMFPLKVSALSADSITAPSAVLMETSTGKILFEKNLSVLNFYLYNQKNQHLLPRC